MKRLLYVWWWLTVPPKWWRVWFDPCVLRPLRNRWHTRGMYWLQK
jgi:hypothetical protein